MSAPVPGEPSEQVFSEAAREAAASAISGEFGYGDCFAACDLEGGHERERWLQLAAASLAAAVDADPRAKAGLDLARMPLSAVVERGCAAVDWDAVREGQADPREAAQYAILAALGFQETTP